MRHLVTLTSLTHLVFSIFTSHAVPYDLFTRRAVHAGDGIHLPIYRNSLPALRRRAGNTGAIGLGDSFDVTYNVLMTVGTTQIPIVLDTGSSDLWVISNACTFNCIAGVPLYPQATFKPAGLDARLAYGDSKTGTHAYGLIGTDSVALAGFSLQDQYFAAINDTNTSVLDSGSAGIFGLGFPINSNIFAEVFGTNQSKYAGTSKRENDDISSDYALKRTANPSQRALPHNFNQPSFPVWLSSHSQARQEPTGPSTITTSVLDSYRSTGPLLSRLVVTNSLAAPMFTVTLQRDTVDIGGNVGSLSLGELPNGVKNESLTWVPIRAYTPAQGGLPPPPDSPNEVYPLAWEVAIDDVFLDGQRLPRSTLSPTISPSALIDTGNSLLRGPPDVLKAIDATLGSTFPCSTPHTLAFQIGGKRFPVDPRDLISPANSDSISECITNLAATDTPVEGKGFLHNWSLGDPFLKSVLSSYYYGNLSYPSHDPPRMGFLSTVPADAGDELKTVVQVASSGSRTFPISSEGAPTAVPTAATTNSDGVPQASGTEISKQNNNGASRLTAPLMDSWFAVLLVGMIIGGRWL